MSLRPDTPPHQVRSLVTFLGVLCAAASLVGCGSPQGSPQARKPATMPPPLTERAATYWKEKNAENWVALYPFVDPADREGSTVDEFVEWSTANDPFQIHSYAIDKVETDGNLGWVHVTYRTTLRRFPNLAPQDAEQWQKWRIHDGQWYPVPMRELGNYPDPPAKRDAQAEAILRQRFMESWRARKARDWSHLYSLSDPQDHGKVSLDEFAGSEQLFEYIECEVLWVEAVDDRGKVRARVRHKIVDPNLTKLEARDAVATEPWVKVDGQWYRDLLR